VPFVASYKILCPGSLGALKEAIVGLMGGDVYVLRGEDHNANSPQVAQKRIHGVSIEGKLWPFEHRFVLGKDDRGETKPDAPN